MEDPGKRLEHYFSEAMTNAELKAGGFHVSIEEMKRQLGTIIDTKLSIQEKEDLFDVISFSGKKTDPIKRTSLGYMVIKDGKIIDSTL